MTSTFKKVPSYQNPTARRVEYFHHILCFSVGVLSEEAWRDNCPGWDYNPFISLMWAEFSTPMLQVWRYYGSSSKLFLGIFTVMFFACRIAYHGFVFLPKVSGSCGVRAWGPAIPYCMMNAYFFVTMVQKLLSKPRSDKDRSKGKEGKQ
jgi:hypothetical protein